MMDNNTIDIDNMPVGDVEEVNEFSFVKEGPATLDLYSNSTDDDDDYSLSFEEDEQPEPIKKQTKKTASDAINIEDLGTSSTPLVSSEQSYDESVEVLKDILREKGVDAEVLEFEDGSYKNVDELSEEELAYFINELSETDSEKDLGDYLGNDADFNLITETYLEEGLEGLAKLLKESGLLDDPVVDKFESVVDKMSDDELLILDIQEKCTYCDEDDIEEEFYRRKQSRTISKYMKGLRERYKEQEEYKIQEMQKQQLEEDYARIEQEKQILISTVESIPTIAGYKNSSEIKNSILPDLLTPDEEEEYSIFISELLSDPVKQYKAAFWLKYGDKIMEDHKEDIKKAEERGKLKIFNGLPSSPKHKTTIDKPRATQSGKTDRAINIEDL